ncbi:uncharacterized protein LOC134529288 [Bacillus rossius redtenbacheri]|uniref:uncharacterized protein LOC134529288 n=1 Tax=Bacillus rossius redtenbacheri TaxID=93214 RepID=UPI002FDC9E17
MDACKALLVLWCFVLAAAHEVSHPHYGSKVLSRRKRYVVFPEGSSFAGCGPPLPVLQVAFCLSWKALTGESSIFTGGMAWGVSYDLPNETLSDTKGPVLPAPQVFRRHRRDLYRRVEAALDSAGLDGRACVLRTLCETAQRLRPRSSLFLEIFRILFTLPLERVEPHEPSEHQEYDSAHRGGLANHNCVQMYPACTVSMLDFLLQEPQTDYE